MQDFFVSYLNQKSIRDALGVNVTYSYHASNIDVSLDFQQTGDYVYPDFLKDLEFLLDRGVRVT